MQKLPLITIGITCYNAETTIKKALESAFLQDWPNFEIVVVDDCSTDNSLRVINDMDVDKECLNIVALTTNSGVSTARNTIIEHANGDFIAFFDDDDESDPQRLTEQYERISKYEKNLDVDLVVCHTARLQVFPDGSQRYEPTIGIKKNSVVPHSTAVADQILIGKPMGEPVASCATCSQMARKSTYERIGKFNELLRRSEDTDFNVRLALAGGHFVGIEKPLVKQNMTISAEKNIDEERHNALLWLENHRDYLKKIGWYKHAYEWLDIKYDYLSGFKLRFLVRMFILFIKSPKKTLSRLYWAWPNRQYSKAQVNWNLECRNVD